MGNVTHEQMRLYAITDSRWCTDESLEEKVSKALEAGATFLQLRDKNASHEERVSMARRLKAIALRYNIPVVVNDDVLAAVEADADGVHIGQSDMEYSKARQLLGPEKIIGMTTKTVEQAIKAQTLGADYVGAGAVFTTDTKTDTRTMSKEMLTSITEAVDIPVVAIGGINYDNMDYVKDCGVAGVAVVSAIFAASDVSQAAGQLRKKADELFA